MSRRGNWARRWQSGWRLGGLWLLAAAGSLLGGSFQVGLDRESVEVGGTAVLVYNFSDFGNVDAPPLPKIPGAEVQYLGASTQSSITIVNGRRNDQTILQHRYAIVPKAAGVLRIPETQLNIAGETVTARAMQLTVTKALDLTDVARLEITTPTNTLYVGQPFVAWVRFWARQSPSQVGNPQLPTDGFVSGRPVKGRSAPPQRVGGENWSLTEFPVLLSPARAGSLPIGPAEMEAIFPVGPRRGGLFGDFFSEQRRFSFRSSSNVVEVVAPPAAGQPPGYNGAIGRFGFRMSAQPTTVSVGDPITVRVIVQGKGGLENLALPEFPPDSGFRTYAGTNGVQWRDPLKFEGEKVFELAVVPERADLTALKFPPLVSFDPDTQKYVVVEGPAVPLTVKPGASAQAAPSVAPTYAANVSTNEGPVTAAQLQPLGPRGDRTVVVATPWTARPWYWLLLIGPPGGMAGWWLLEQLARRRREDPEVARRAAARDRTAAAWSQLTHAQGAEFFEALDRALREQVALVADIPPGAVDVDTLDLTLTPRGLVPEESRRLRRLFEAVEAGRFAPVPSAANAAELRDEAGRAQAALRQLEARA